MLLINVLLLLQLKPSISIYKWIFKMMVKEQFCFTFRLLFLVSSPLFAVYICLHCFHSVKWVCNTRCEALFLFCGKIYLIFKILGCSVKIKADLFPKHTLKAHEGTGGVTLLILHLGSRRVPLSYRVALTQFKYPFYPLNRRMFELVSWPRHFE